MGVVCGFLGGDWWISRWRLVRAWVMALSNPMWVMGLESVWIVVDRWVLNRLRWLGFELVWIVACRGGLWWLWGRGSWWIGGFGVLCYVCFFFFFFGCCCDRCLKEEVGLV